MDDFQLPEHAQNKSNFKSYNNQQNSQMEGARMVNQNEISSNTRSPQNEEQYVTSIAPVSKDDNSHTNPIIITPYPNDKRPNPNTPPLNQNEILNNNRIHFTGTIGSGTFNGYYHTDGDQREIE